MWFDIFFLKLIKHEMQLLRFEGSICESLFSSSIFHCFIEYLHLLLDILLPISFNVTLIVWSNKTTKVLMLRLNLSLNVIPKFSPHKQIFRLTVVSIVWSETNNHWENHGNIMKASIHWFVASLWYQQSSVSMWFWWWRSFIKLMKLRFKSHQRLFIILLISISLRLFLSK